MAAKRIDLVVTQGETFERIIRWETAPLIYTPVTNITQGAPATITAAGHGVVDGWRVGLVGVKGMTEMNMLHGVPPRDSDLRAATFASSSVLQLNEVSSCDFEAYESGGFLVHWTPHDLTGYTARMEIKDRIEGTVLFTVTGLVVDAAAKTITLTIDADDAAAFDWIDGVYDLEMVSPVSSGSKVTAIMAGTITVQEEVTT